MAEPSRLVDTTILVDYLRGNQVARTWLKQFSGGELAVSIISAAEIVAGCRNLKEQRLVEKELALYPLIMVSSMSSETAWNWYRQFRLSHGIGFLDCLIAACAYHQGLIVCTLYEKHFRPFPNLVIERPY